MEYLHNAILFFSLILQENDPELDKLEVYVYNIIITAFHH